MKFGKRTEFEKKFYEDNLMGPSAVRIIDELAGHLTLTPDMRVLDLGCGTGLTSIYLAQEFGVQVFATDLWTPAVENYKRIQAFELEGKIIPIHCDASQELPFADGYFDAIISVDAYYYFGTGADYIDKRMKPLLKSDGFLAVAMPGLKKEFAGNVPDEMKPFWVDEVNDTFHDLNWWRALWSKSESMHVTDAFPLTCNSEAWQDWLKTDNPYAKSDIAMMEAEGGKYFDMLGLVGS
ncbi:MAG: methyltransferase domain-containing protein [Bifidobacteriaceae bacterium]|jgi:cyclopropane fatty-acyl-phospholipid synthase-like methyltransferase|nr:methyltransferase domain-containing protein [Bifidobacteriaceae bacterium]